MNWTKTLHRYADLSNGNKINCHDDVILYIILNWLFYALVAVCRTIVLTDTIVVQTVFLLRVNQMA